MRIRELFTIMLLAVPVVAIAQSQSSTMRWDGRPAPRGETLFKAAVMQAHNQERTRSGETPLIWDDKLAADAASYARTLAAENRFAHDPQIDADERQGENLWMGTRGAYPYSAMIDNWVVERQYYRPGRFPDISRNGNWAAVGHYTQVVWPGTKTVGCAIAGNAENEFLVCRYLPAGNVVGFAMR